MHLKNIDLNLLRLFDAVYRHRSVSRAAESLDLTQPAASHGLTRLRTLVHDPLFVRTPGGVRPTPEADRLADPVRHALRTIEEALSASRAFEPLQSGRTFRLHMSDIGEGRFVPDLMVVLREQAPGVRIETLPLPRGEITAALDSGRIDFAIGFLPMVKDTRSVELLRDRYIVLLPSPDAGVPPGLSWNGCASWNSWRSAPMRTPCASCRCCSWRTGCA
jgi:DNA-binding transcriptional LysR family regulator